MISYNPNLTTVHKHFSKGSFTFPNHVRPQELPQQSPDLLTGEERGVGAVAPATPPIDSVIDEQSSADVAAGSTVSSF